MKKAEINCQLQKEKDFVDVVNAVQIIKLLHIETVFCFQSDNLNPNFPFFFDRNKKFNPHRILIPKFILKELINESCLIIKTIFSNFNKVN